MITLSIGRGYVCRFTTEDLDDLSEKIRAVVYARVSTHDQAKHGYSLESQVERCVSLAKTKFNIIETEIIAVIEQGEMGDDPNRPALTQALWFIEQGIGTKFIVLHPDRLARDLKLQLFVTERIWNAGCEICFVEMDVDRNNPESVLLYNIQGAIAQYNKAKILANSRRGRRTKVRNGKIPGLRRIYGYKFDKENDILIEDTQEKESYLMMVNWILYGKEGQKMNLSSVARELSLLGIPAPNGDKWYQSTVSRILKNPVYTGKFYYGKTEYKQRAGSKEIIKKPKSEWQMIQVPAYIDDTTFSALQKRITSFTYSNRGAKPKVAYLLKGIVRCGRCGAAVVAGAPSRHKKTKEILYRYYVCSAKSRKIFEVGSGKQVHTCKGRNWRKDIVDGYVWRYVVYHLINSHEILLKITTQKIEKQHLQDLNHRRQRLQISLAEKKAERKRWLQLHIKGKIADTELDEGLIPLEKDIAKLEESLQFVDDSFRTLCSNQLHTTEQNIEQFRLYLQDKIPDADKQKLINGMIRQVVLHHDEIHIYTAWDVGVVRVDFGSI